MVHWGQSSIETVVSTVTYRCSSSFTNTTLILRANSWQKNKKTKTQMFKTKTKTLKSESRDVSRPRLKSREPQLWKRVTSWGVRDINWLFISRTTETRAKYLALNIVLMLRNNTLCHSARMHFVRCSFSIVWVKPLGPLPLRFSDIFSQTVGNF